VQTTRTWSDKVKNVRRTHYGIGGGAPFSIQLPIVLISASERQQLKSGMRAVPAAIAPPAIIF